ncbi:NAD(P)/FAD-dependent oxidoreductase [Rhodobacter lacus]|uniref:NAD(P)/FAD-dependent oxidoreductase n=1 Tax=Rhodobacter lacus TaxID=1641972 RepID=A0ABW5A851_9RHOB
MIQFDNRLNGAALRPYWFETVPVGPPCPPPGADLRADLAIVGGGFTGLWAAVHARLRAPEARIVLLEAGRSGEAASGRNGGFCAPSISHGVATALMRWPAEAETLIRLGRENLDGYARDVDTLGLDIGFRREGKLTIARTPWQEASVAAMARDYRRFGIDCTVLTGAALRTRLDSPIHAMGLFEPNYALVNPAQTVAELRRVALKMGVEIHEETPVTALREGAQEITLRTPGAVVQADRVILATNAAVPLLKRLRPAIIPIFDYTILTRPLSDNELAAIGWTEGHSVADMGNQFHYLRKTDDNRILCGGYDAIYHFGARRDAELLDRVETYDRLAKNFARALPQLAHVPFTHAWGGIIDTSARTTLFAGQACKGRLAYAMGFTGQGVSASRFAALAMLDMLEGRDTERTRLQMLRRPPFPFPPEPLRWLGVRWAQAGLAAEDRTGRRSVLNRMLDKMGIGFNS